MKSIRTKIIAALLVVIVTTVALVTAVATLNFKLLDRYREINENIVLEQELKDNILFLVEDAYNGFKANDYGEYDQRLAKVREVERLLDAEYGEPQTTLETRIAFRGVKNSLDAVIKVVEDARETWDRGEISSLSDIFRDASVKFEFLKENITDLLFVETKNIAVVTQDIKRIQAIFNPLVAGVIAFVTVILVFFSLAFAKKLSDPIRSLSSVAKGISGGDLGQAVPSALFERKDEIGALATSFDFMVKKLQEKIGELVTNNKELEESKEAVLDLLEDVEEQKKGVEKVVVERTRELANEKARLLASINSLSFGFMIADKDNRVILSNVSMRSILETNEIPETMDVFRNSFGVFDIMSFINDSVGQRKPLERKDVLYHQKYLRFFCSPVMSDGEPIGYVITVEDTTEAKALERSKEEFFAVASHELRTPLTAIKGNSEMMLQLYLPKIQDEDMKEMLSDIHTASVRLIGIVNEFLEVSRIEQGKIEVKKERFKVPEIIDGVIRDMKILAAANKTAVTYIPPTNTLPDALGDRNRTEQVLVNLVGNAIKFTHDGSVTISADIVDAFIKVTVEDTGIGISEQNQPFLFRKFQQAGEKILARDASQGTGLGLYISHMLMTGMGGDIRLERSTLGKGSVFSFTIPIAS